MVDVALWTETFAYDAWANAEWLSYLGSDSPDLPIFAHILAAQRIWLSRCEGVRLESPPTIVPSLSEIEALRSGWVSVLSANAHDPVVDYHQFNGTARSLPLTGIVRHVLNHGTYHRGELRGLCRARGETGFPETDLSLFFTLEP